MPALQHLGGDRWRTGIYIGRDPDGHQRRLTKVIHAKDLKEANAKADAARVELREQADREAAHWASFGGYLDQWLTECATRLAPATITTYRIQAAKIARQFGHRRIIDVTSADVRAWYASLTAAGVTPVTLTSINSVLRAVLRQAVADGHVATPATFGIRRPRVPRRKFNLPSDAAITEAIAGAHPDLIIGATLAGLGLRRGEVTRTTWGDITGRELHVRGTKTEGSDRTVALSYRTMRVLAHHRRRQVTDAARLGSTISRSDPNRPILAHIEIDPTARTAYDPAWVTRTWRTIATARNSPVKDMHFHDLRHWAASRLFAANVPAHEVAEQLGHSKVSTTLDIYGQVLDKTARRKARAKLLD